MPPMLLDYDSKCLSACIVIILYYNSACLSVHKVVQGGASNGGAVAVHVTMGGGDTTTKGRAKKGPKNKKEAGELYTINFYCKA